MDGTDHPTRRAGRIRDARGRSARVIDPVALAHLGRRDVVAPETLEAIRVELDPSIAATDGRRTRRRFGIAFAAALGVFGVIAFVAILASGDQNARRTLTEPQFIVPMLVGVVIAATAGRGRRHRTLARVMLAHRVCPHCGYDLRGRSPEGDGSTVCTECGHAWAIESSAAHDTAGAPPAIAPEVRAGHRRFVIVLATILGALALLVSAMLIHEFNN